MKILQKSLTVLLTAAILLTALSCLSLPVFAAGSCGADLTWTLNGSTLIISGEGDMTDFLYEQSPWYAERKSISFVSLPDGLTSIGDNAFLNCTNLSSVTVRGLITKVGWNTFRNCPLLDGISLPSTVLTIEDGAFAECASLTSFVIPKNTESINQTAFEGCVNMQAYGIESGNAHFLVDDGIVFEKNDDNPQQHYLRLYPASKPGISYSVPSDVMILFPYCFADNRYLESILLPDSVLSMNNAFVRCQQLRSIIIPDSVTNIGSSCFSSCPLLASVTLSKNISAIPWWCFSSCTSLSSITIPAAVTDIGVEAFKGCTALATVSFADESKLQTVNSSAFSGCTALEAIELPETVTAIKSEAFRGCTKLATVTTGDKLIEVRTRAFKSCSSLTGFTIPESSSLYITIESEAFYGCTAMTGNFYLPRLVKTIGNMAFANTGLSGFTVNATNSYFCAVNGVLFNKAKTNLVQYPAGRANTYYTVPRTVTRLSAGAFSHATALGGVITCNKIIYTSDSIFEGVSSAFILYGDKESVMQTYAQQNNIAFSVRSMGDLNNSGSLNTANAFTLFRGASGGLILTPLQTALADITGDGTVDMRDAYRLFSFVSGTSTQL